jgi:hypothetical protein
VPAAFLALGSFLALAGLAAFFSATSGAAAAGGDSTSGAWTSGAATSVAIAISLR